MFLGLYLPHSTSSVAWPNQLIKCVVEYDFGKPYRQIKLTKSFSETSSQYTEKLKFYVGGYFTQTRATTVKAISAFAHKHLFQNYVVDATITK